MKEIIKNIGASFVMYYLVTGALSLTKAKSYTELTKIGWLFGIPHIRHLSLLTWTLISWQHSSL